MSEQTKSRFAVDLDDLERQLRQTAGGQPRAPHNDPLAELARIVGQDDPFKAMFAERKPPAPALVPAAQVYRRTDSAPAVNGAMDHGAAPSFQANKGAPLDSDALDEFDALLQAELRGGVSPQSGAQSGVHASSIADELERELAAERDFAKPKPKPFAKPDPAEFARAAEPQDLDDLRQQSWARDEDQREPSQSPEALAYPDPPEEPQEDLRSLEPQQPRKGLVIAGALLGVAVLGIGTVVGMRGLSGPVRLNGDPPVIKAEAGPTKVQPQNPGGVEIPNQNKQILERTPEPRAADTRVVNREEQPMDVQAAARAAPRVILPGPSSGPTSAGQPNGSSAAADAPGSAAGASSVAVTPAAGPQAASAALGEPRRVRTVAVRPDGSIAPPAGAGNGTAATPAGAAPGSAPATTASSTPRAALAPTPPRPPAPPRAEEAAAARPPQARTQVAASPSAASVPAPVPAPAAAEPAAAGSGFMVQLGAPGSESEARATFASLQRRFSEQLGSDQPTIRRADVGNGRTVYRLRVGPYGREAAAEKCEALKAAGGNCFIARN